MKIPKAGPTILIDKVDKAKENEKSTDVIGQLYIPEPPLDLFDGTAPVTNVGDRRNRGMGGRFLQADS